MIRITTLTFLAALVGLPLFFSSCAGAPPPFGTGYQAYRGLKARTFRGTPEEIRPAVIATLRDMGYEIHTEQEDPNFVTANRGMGAVGADLPGGQRTWTRVGVQVRQVDMHRRAPRTLVDIDAENIQGTASGPIDASFGAVPSSFYEAFFQDVEARTEALRPRPVQGLLPPA